MSDVFYTIASSGEARFTEKRSRFLAFASHVATVEEAKKVIDFYSREYHDARHVCWAYMVGPEREQYLSSDNGEPSGTAGRPIMGQINSFGLTDVVVVVVRYFGGIKLGTPGLIAAYRESARLALEAAGKQECHQTETVGFTFSYLVMNDVMKAAKQPWVEVVGQEFDNVCRMTLRVRLDDLSRLMDMLGKVEGLVVD